MGRQQRELIKAECQVRESGEDIRSGARTFDVLVALIQRAPDLISKRELLDRLWPGLTVGEGSLRF